MEETESRTKENVKKKKRVKHSPLFWVVLTIVTALILPGLYVGLTVRHYEIETEKLSGTLRIALVTDLHSCYYGKDQKTLIRAIDAQKPDVILLGGDIFDDRLSDRNTERFLAGIARRYPCYYVTGNHECWAGGEEFRKKMAILETYGITRLAGEGAEISVGEEKVVLFGVDDPDSYLVQSVDDAPAHQGFQAQLSAITPEVKKAKEQGEYVVLLCHRPGWFSSYAAAGFDLALAGHEHGGQWRIPGLLNGLVAPDEGLFPKLAGGRYEEGNTTMIVSRGLARESTPVPRFYNPPELVIIDLK